MHQVENNSTIAFGTLALGPEFRILARLLAFDLLSIHPDLKIYVLTDKPLSFSDFPNVIAIDHQFGGVRACYHDKRHVVRAVLKENDVCVFLDADSRLIAPVDFAEISQHECFMSGLTRNLGSKVEQEIRQWTPRPSINNPRRKRRVLTGIARKYGLQLNDVTYIHEAFFIVQKKYGDHLSFLDQWDVAARYATLRLFEFSEGSVMGIVAAASGCNIQQFDGPPKWLFKDLYRGEKNKTKQEAAINANVGLLRKSIGRERMRKARYFPRPLIYLLRYLTVLSNSQPLTSDRPTMRKLGHL